MARYVICIYDTGVRRFLYQSVKGDDFDADGRLVDLQSLIYNFRLCGNEFSDPTDTAILISAGENVPPAGAAADREQSEILEMVVDLEQTYSHSQVVEAANQNDASVNEGIQSVQGIIEFGNLNMEVDDDQLLLDMDFDANEELYKTDDDMQVLAAELNINITDQGQWLVNKGEDSMLLDDGHFASHSSVSEPGTAASLEDSDVLTVLARGDSVEYLSSIVQLDHSYAVSSITDMDMLLLPYSPIIKHGLIRPVPNDVFIRDSDLSEFKQFLSPLSSQEKKAFTQQRRKLKNQNYSLRSRHKKSDNLTLLQKEITILTRERDELLKENQELSKEKEALGDAITTLEGFLLAA